MTFLFEKLDVYQKALSFADQTSTLTARFPRPFWYLADQFNRASLSIALNIAEGNGRGTPLDKRRFLLISRGSTFECVTLVDMCGRKGLIAQEVSLELRRVLTDLSKMLSRMIEKLGSAEAVREEVTTYPSNPAFTLESLISNFGLLMVAGKRISPAQVPGGLA